MIKGAHNTLITLVSLFAVLAFSCANSQEHTAPSTSQDTLSAFRHFYWNNIPKYTGWVNDFDKLYTDVQTKTLDSIINAFNRQTGIQVSIVTLDTNCVSSDSFDKLTLHIANTWGVGEKGKDNGILISISNGYEKMRINNGYGIEKIISDKETKMIIHRYFIPSFRNKEYYNGTLTGTKALMELLKSKLQTTY